jgi:predicted small metal-binding protein
MRVFVDCRQIPSESNCTLTIAGEEAEVLRAAVAHAIDVHGHKEDEALREGIRGAMAPENKNYVEGYGTTMTAKLRKGVTIDQFADILENWEKTRQVPGFVGAQLSVSDDGATVVNTAVFTDRDAYMRLADDPVQDKWYQSTIAPMLDGEPQWIDGPWSVYYRQPAITLPTQTGAKSTVKT